jgi:hypothetical protein
MTINAADQIARAVLDLKEMTHASADVIASDCSLHNGEVLHLIGAAGSGFTARPCPTIQWQTATRTCRLESLARK